MQWLSLNLLCGQLQDVQKTSDRNRESCSFISRPARAQKLAQGTLASSNA